MGQTTSMAKASQADSRGEEVSSFSTIFFERYHALLRRIWKSLPHAAQESTPGIAFGRFIHAQIQRHSARRQSFGTFFLRNRAELDTMCQLLSSRETGSNVRIAVLACSKGAEVYSIMWALRTRLPHLTVHISAVDISEEILEFAENGVFSIRTDEIGKAIERDAASSDREVVWRTQEDQNASVFERVDQKEMRAIAEIEGEFARIKQFLKEGIDWVHGDAFDPKLVARLGEQDVVVANRFLCHMQPRDAERCLRNVAKLAAPDGYIFVSGVDLEVRTKVAVEQGWRPMTEMLKEIHDGDVSLRQGWPVQYWGLEPFCSTEDNPQFRYASVYQIPTGFRDASQESKSAGNVTECEMV